MSRVFPIEEWAPLESRTSISSTGTPANELDDTRFSNLRGPVTPGRKRLNSLPLANMIDRVHGFSMEEQQQDDGKRVGTLRGLIRRASISIKNRQRRHSHAVEDRPQTAWHKLKGAASFSRHTKFPSAQLDSGVTSDFSEEWLAPIPGTGSEPPYIPRGSGGAAARATAAAQNEWFGRGRHLLFSEDPFEDRESGIGISVNASELVLADGSTASISRVDFIAELPVEIAIQILAHLNQRSLRQATLVSQRWSQLTHSPHVWREVFLREQRKTYATSEPLALGAGLGLPSFKPDHDWKDLYRIRNQLEQNWVQGAAESVYLNGHLDSIYCVQFDE
jgi:F-box and WD-40 domain protein 1/11